MTSKEEFVRSTKQIEGIPGPVQRQDRRSSRWKVTGSWILLDYKVRGGVKWKVEME